MNIGYLYEFHAYPPKGGNHRHAYELTQGFTKLGNHVHVLDDPTMPEVTNYSGPHDIEKFLRAIDIIYIRIDGRKLKHSDTIRKIMSQKQKIPIVWEVNAPANEALAYSWLGGKTSTQKDPLNIYLKRWLHAARQYPEIWQEESFRKKLAQNVDAAICVTTALSNYCKKGLGIDNSIVIPNGGPIMALEEINKRKAKRADNQFTVLYSGSAIYPWQGMQYITETIQLAHKQNLNIKFKLAVNQKTEYLPALPNVTIFEGQNYNQILDLICTSDVCLAFHPEYFWSRWKFHGSPMKLFEYMGCATASLSSNIGQMKDLIHPDIDGYLCPNNPHKILKKLIGIKNNKKERENIGYEGWKRIQTDLNWAKNVKKTLNIFQSLIH